MTVIAMIPAREKSKRIPGKNFKLFNGQPLIYWTIKAAIESTKIDHVYFTTENPRLAELANDLAYRVDPTFKKFNVYIRPEKLAQDHVQTDEVFCDLLRWLESRHVVQDDDTLVLLQPPSPYRDAEDIDYALNLWGERTHGSLISGTIVDGFYWKFEEDLQGDFNQILPIGHDPRARLGGQWIKPSEKTVKENGAIYICNAREFSLYRTYRMPPYILYHMSEERSVDLDTEADFDSALALVKTIRTT